MPRFALLTAAIVCLAALTASADEPAPKFVLLFNGKDLDGWAGDPDLWHVESGAIVGSTDGKRTAKNTFLVAKQEYKNFILKLKFKLRNHNSGVQFRSDLQSNYVVSGYQADIADTDSMGMLYEELGRSRLKLADPTETAKHVHKDDWNDYVITADGPHITLAINGYTTVDYTETSDKGSDEGIIALQLHAGPAMKVEFKDIEIAELP
jgi:Domain of Unknown Function (DUF1080)